MEIEVTREEYRTEAQVRWYQKIRPHPEYLRTIPGILKIVEIILCIVILICTSVSYFKGYGFVHFASATALINVVMNFICHFVDIHHYFIFWYFLEFVEYCIYDVLLFISAIIAAVYSASDPAVAASTFFIFAGVAVFLVDTYFMFRAWREHKLQHVATQEYTGVTTVTTVTPVRTK